MNRGGIIVCEAQDTAVEGEDRSSVWVVRKNKENKMMRSLGFLRTGRFCWLDFEFSDFVFLSYVF